MNVPFTSSSNPFSPFFSQDRPLVSPVRPDCEGRRLGFHYFPDTLHYREADLQMWLPELTGLGVSWLVLRSETGRAIPERFLRGLKSAGIEPLIQFELPLDRLPDSHELSTLLDVYAQWGARYLMFFDRPNARASWPATSWAQQDLVERFLDRYLPLAAQALQTGLVPVLPPLEPGGSYWDTAFLRSTLQAIQRRKQDALLQNLVLSAYAWQNPQGASRSLDWGAGGPERWPQARPYHTPHSSQDQRGFRIFDWYNAVTRSVLHQDCPMILLQAACPGDPQALAGQSIQTPSYADSCLAIVKLLAGEAVRDPLEETNPLEALPPNILACNFWLLSADSTSPFAGHAWFPAAVTETAGPGIACTGGESGGEVPMSALPQMSFAARALRQWRCEWQSSQPRSAASSEPTRPAAPRPIRHYLLIPGYEWGVSDWYLEVIRPFVKKYRPTVGFSVDEAVHAARVTVVGNPQNFPEDMLSRLQAAGCWIEQINGDGTKIASVLAER